MSYVHFHLQQHRIGFQCCRTIGECGWFCLSNSVGVELSNHPCLQFTSTLRSWFDLDGNAFVQGLCNCFLWLPRVFSEWPSWYSHSPISFQLPLVGKDRMTFPILPTMMAVEELPKDFEFSCKMSCSCYCWAFSSFLFMFLKNDLNVEWVWGIFDLSIDFEDITLCDTVFRSLDRCIDKAC